MKIDLNSTDNIILTDRKYDVCIVGAGASGIVLADELDSSGLSVALCEAGGMEFEDRSQACYKGRIKGDAHRLFDLDVSRLRYFGGTTGHWHGYCRPFIPIDFERDYLDGGLFKWPIEFSEVDLYSKKVAHMLNLNSVFNDEININKPFRKIDYQFSDKIGEKFRNIFLNNIINSDSLHLYLNANLIDIDGNLHSIHSAEFTNYNKEKFKIFAKKFVFAMGGIENSRFMLWFSQKYQSKYFDDKTPIGRYWNEHPHTYNVGISFQKSFSDDFPLTDWNAYLISEDLQRERGILSSFIICQTSDNVKFNESVKNDFRAIAPGFQGKTHDGFKSCEIHVISEQIPSADNFVKLSPTEKDYFGIPRVELSYKLNKIDKETIIVSISKFVEYLLEAGIGRVKLHDEIYNLLRFEDKILTLPKIPNSFDFKMDSIWRAAGNHHMGALRMFENEKYGVVDSNCKVFGSENLYITGSSVFTISGAGNPTFPIIQLTLRLSDHLKQIL